MGAKRPQAPASSSSESEEEEEENHNPPSKKLAATAPNAAASSSSSGSESESEEEEENPKPPLKKTSPKKPTPSPAAPSPAPDQDSSESDGSDEEAEGEDKGSKSAKQPPAKPKQQETAAAAPAAAPASASAGKVPEKSDSESESESDSGETGSDSDSPIKEPKPKSRPTRGPDPSIKPITSKPMEDSPKLKKTIPAKPSPSPLSSPAKPSAAKRSAPASDVNGKDSKRRRGGAHSDNEEDEAGKKSFARVWNEEDEIVFLKCIVDGMKTGSRRVDDVGALYEAVRNSLNFDVTRGQIANKIRTLKKKFNNTKRTKKGGKEPNFAKAHDKEVFELSNKIWGDQAEENHDKILDSKVISGNADGKSKKQTRTKAAAEEITSPLKAVPEANKPVAAGKSVVVVTAEKPVAAVAEKPVVEAAEKQVVPAEKQVLAAAAEEESCRYPCIVEALNCSQNSWLDSWSKVEVRRALALVSDSKASELERKWRKLHMLQLEAIKMHSGLIQELVDLIRDALMSEDGHALAE
ncbi:hypothetical protein ACLOJK_029884 [Asimina triloba]